MSSYEIVEDVAWETKDEDGTLENEVCENRYKFLRFCGERHYQFDSLRRAKYSSVMILRRILNGLSETSGVDSAAVMQSWEVVEILGHVSKCRESCEMFGCREMHGMFRHVSSGCQNGGYEGGCIVCHKLWYTLHCHSIACSQPNCHIPYCTQLKNT